MAGALFLKKTVCPRLVLVDGLTRSGKMLTAKLVSNFKGMEYFQAFDAVDHIPILWRLGKLDDDTARAFLRMQLDAAIYYRVLGRNLNTRESDSSSVLNALNHEDYTRRAMDTDTGGALDRFTAEGRSPVFFTHEVLPNIELFFSITDDLKVIDPMRHPVDLAYSWLQRGWGERWGDDPLAFVPTLDVDGKAAPWFAADWARDYLALSPMDRVIKGILTLLDLFRETVDGLTPEQRNCIHFYSYEHMLAEPKAQIDKMASFLDTEPLDGMDGIITREKLPAGPQAIPLDQKWKKIASLGDPENLERLIEAGRRHEQEWGLDPLVL